MSDKFLLLLLLFLSMEEQQQKRTKLMWSPLRQINILLGFKVLMTSIKKKFYQFIICFHDTFRVMCAVRMDIISIHTQHMLMAKSTINAI